MERQDSAPERRGSAQKFTLLLLCAAALVGVGWLTHHLVQPSPDVGEAGVDEGASEQPLRAEALRAGETPRTDGEKSSIGKAATLSGGRAERVHRVRITGAVQPEARSRLSLLFGDGERMTSWGFPLGEAPSVEATDMNWLLDCEVAREDDDYVFTLRGLKRGIYYAHAVMFAPSVMVRRSLERRIENPAHGETVLVLGATERTATLKARALDPHGHVLEDWRVRISSPAGRGFPSLTPDNAASGVQVSAGVPLRVRLDKARGWKEVGMPPARVLRLQPGETRTTELRTLRGVQVRIEVHAPDGALVAAGLSMVQDTTPGERRAVGVTSSLPSVEEGVFAGRLRPGRYVGLVRPHARYPAKSFEMEVPEGQASLEQRVQLAEAPEHAAYVRLHLQDEKGVDVEGAHVMLHRVVDKYEDLTYGHDHTDDRGRAAYGPLTPGRYRAVCYDRQQVSELDLVAGAQDVKLAWPATRLPDTWLRWKRERRSAYLAEHYEGDALRARVKHADGRPASGVWVHMRPQGSSVWTLFRSDGDGVLEVGPWPHGTYEVWVPRAWTRDPQRLAMRASFKHEGSEAKHVWTLARAPEAR